MIDGVAPQARGPWTVWVAGQPRCGAAAVAECFTARGPEACAAEPGAWSLVATRRGDARLHVLTDAFGGVPLFVRGERAAVGAPPASWAGPLDPDELRQHLDGRLRQPWRTWYRDVWRVPAGHGGALGHPEVDLRRVYRPRAGGLGLRQAVEQAIAWRLGAAPVEVALSGGLDSAVLAGCLAARGPVVARSARFPGWSCDEGPYLRAVCEGLALPRVDVDARALDPSEVLRRLAPPGFPPLLPNHHLNLALMQPGRTLVTGFGGDEVLGHGFDVVREYASAGRPLAALASAMGLALRYRHAPETTGQAMSRWLREAAGHLGRAPDPEGLRRRRVARALDPLITRSREEQLRLASQLGASLQMPLLDPGVLAAVVDLPASARVRRGLTRAHVRDAFADLLPDVVRRRAHKADLGRSVEERLGEVLEANRGALQAASFTAWVDPTAVREAERAWSAGRHDAAAWLWRAIGAARWLAWHTAAGRWG